jgi:hypothetical protein
MRAHDRYSVAAIGARSVAGITLLTRPRMLLTAVGGAPLDESVVAFARALGARHLVEAAILWRWTTPTLVRAGAAVDMVHAASMLVLSKARRHRRLTICNAISASACAALQTALARGMQR